MENNNISSYELVNDSIMSKDEIIKYISDDFRVDLSDIKKVIIYKYKKEINKPNAIKIIHHRYNLLFEDGELTILPFDGALRIKHITIEIKILEEYLNRKIEIEIIDDGALFTKILENAISDIVSKIDTLDDLQGVIIGSIWNINFFINHKIRPLIYQELFNKFDRADIDKYIGHRLKLLDIENALLKGIINNIDASIFQEGVSPTLDIYNYVENIHKKLELINNNNNLLYDYLALDYVYFNDLKNGTKIFNKSTNFPETQIFSNDLLTYQIINIPNNKGVYLNISWIESSVLGDVLLKLQNIYNFESFLMYGKCGALKDSIKVGSIVAPKSVFGKKKILINNKIDGLKNLNFISVVSPLLETKSWLKNTIDLKVDCVEMELYEIFNRIKMPKHIEIGYYISDNLSSDFKLSNRFDFLHQRLYLSEQIVKKLF